MRPTRLVIADDQAPMRELLSVLIESSGLGELVGVARDGREAVDLVLAHSPDLALLDVDMPRMTGLAAAEVILSYRPGTRVILHTGHDDLEIRTRARQLGLPLLSKIRDPDALAAAIDSDGQPAAGGEAREIAAAVLAAIERSADESVAVVDRDGTTVFYDSQTAEILDLPFPPEVTPYEELRRRVQHVTASAQPRPLVRALEEHRPVQDTMYIRRGERLVACATRAVPIVNPDGELVAAAVYWRELPRADELL